MFIKMNNLTLQKKIKVANKLSIYFYEEGNQWYFYDKKTYINTEKQYKELSLYTIEDIWIDKKELGNRIAYSTLTLCLEASLQYFKLEERFSFLLKLEEQKSFYSKLQDLLPFKKNLEGKHKI